MHNSSDIARHLQQLQETLQREMPICVAMQFAAHSWDDGRLAMQMPLEPNRNHQFSAFAGSLSALCTITGWGAVFMLLRQRGLVGNIVIRRSRIRYLRPVRCEQIVAKCRALEAEVLEYFFELLECKGRSKVDVSVEIADQDGPYVTFSGSYVVQEWSKAP